MSRPLFAHQLEALLRLQEMQDEEVLGKTTKRKRGREKEALYGRVVASRTWHTEIDWFAPTFIVDWSRGVPGIRIPYVGLTSITRCDVPRSNDGKTHPRYPDQRNSCENHFGYIERQHRESYIERKAARDLDDDGRYQFVLTNISQNPQKRREFIRKVTEFEQRPHAPRLWAWSSDLAFWERAADSPDAPLWVRTTATMVQVAVEHNEIKQKNTSKPKPFRVDLGTTTPEEAYERLTWCDQHTNPGQLPPLDFESKSGGRIQYRLVFELPSGLSAKERFEIARAMARWCKKMRFMYVIAIHRPDGHNDSRNFHIHCDFYDRPCRWFKALGKWDFEIIQKARNGDLKRPFCKNKIASFSRDPDRKLDRKTYGEQVLKDLRAFIVDECNKVLQAAGLTTRYHPGPLSDLGVFVSKMKKLGGTKMARERQGFHTDDGTVNGKAIWSDRETKIEADLASGLATHRMLVSEFRTKLRETGRGHNVSGMRLHTDIQGLAEKREVALRLRAEFDRAETAFARARSRAEAVLREHKKVDETRERGKSFSKSVLAEERDSCVADARQHLAGVDEVAPKEMDWISAEAEIVRLERECHGLEADIRADLVDLTLEVKEREIRLPAAKLGLDGYLEPLADRDPDRIERLRSWLKENRGSVCVEEDSLVVPAPQAILTIIARHQDTREVRALLGLALVDNLMREAEQKRWPMVTGSGGLELGRQALVNRQFESEVVERQYANPAVQKRLERMSRAQETERRLVVEAVKTAAWVQQADGRFQLASDAFPRLWEYILIWQRDQEVRKALKARQAELNPIVPTPGMTPPRQFQGVSSMGAAPVVASKSNSIDLLTLATAYAKGGGRGGER